MTATSRTWDRDAGIITERRGHVQRVLHVPARAVEVATAQAATASAAPTTFETSSVVIPVSGEVMEDARAMAAFHRTMWDTILLDMTIAAATARGATWAYSLVDLDPADAARALWDADAARVDADHRAEVMGRRVDRLRATLRRMFRIEDDEDAHGFVGDLAEAFGVEYEP